MTTKQRTSLRAKLTEIQNALNCPKSQYNNFGKYNYRSLEDIFEALKPLLQLYHVTLYVQDEPILIGDRHYIQSTATLTDMDSDETIVTKAVAMESDAKKGMDSAQVTGATSSYCRKYLLNGLFLIDDTKDADSTAHTAKTQGKDMPTHSIDPEHVRSLSDAKDTTELLAAWKAIPIEVRYLHNDLKNELKNKFNREGLTDAS